MTPEKNGNILQAILRIQAGDELTREDFISEYRPFIAKTAMNLCKRPLDWEDSDEMSIALIAFNTAINSYDPVKKVPFLPYAKVVIQNRLKDHFRKESRLCEARMHRPVEEGIDPENAHRPPVLKPQPPVDDRREAVNRSIGDHSDKERVFNRSRRALQRVCCVTAKK